MRMKGKSLKISTNPAGRQRSGITMDFRFTFEVLDNSKKACACMKVRAIQMSGRFNSQGNPAKIGPETERGRRMDMGTD